MNVACLEISARYSSQATTIAAKRSLHVGSAASIESSIANHSGKGIVWSTDPAVRKARHPYVPRIPMCCGAGLATAAD